MIYWPSIQFCVNHSANAVTWIIGVITCKTKQGNSETVFHFPHSVVHIMRMAANSSAANFIISIHPESLSLSVESNFCTERRLLEGSQSRSERSEIMNKNKECHNQ
jgi:hypothetical protein